ncbi:MAG: hypothetical protein GY900_02155 [Actinomycetia bacterium]|nr:hypothetical protein [Actinomycetes bacterium]
MTIIVMIFVTIIVMTYVTIVVVTVGLMMAMLQDPSAIQHYQKHGKRCRT